MMGRESIRASYLPQNSSNSRDSLVSGRMSHLGVSSHSKQSKRTEKSLSFNQLLNPNDAHSFLEESGSSKQSLFKR